MTRPLSGLPLGFSDHSGAGQLSVTNGTADDAVVFLLDYPARQHALYAMFVRSSESATLIGVREGTYTLRFQVGHRWTRRGWTCQSHGTTEFNESFDFGTEKGVEGWSVTLHRVTGGNARSHAEPDTVIALPGA
jgi:hypothetical protein